MAASYLKGEALLLWVHQRDNFKREGIVPTYQDFKQTLLSHFSETHISDEAISQMLELKEKEGKHNEYKTAFNSLRAHLPQDKGEALELVLVALYKKGLTQETGFKVILDPTTGKRHRNLKTLQDHAQAASEVKEISQRNKEFSLKRERTLVPKIKRTKGVFKKPFKGKPKLIKGMTSEEIRTKGLCLGCGESGHRAKECPKKKSKFQGKSEN